jgi:ubiquinone/menaquinone biosynthesis C-methylase UbiE
MTMQLSKEFTSVHAVDVSPDMLAYAKRNIVSPNVTFHLSSGNALPVPSNSVSAVFSTHVFQHFDSLEVGRQNFREIHRVLAPKGTFLIHVPVHVWPGRRQLFESLLAARRGMGQMKASMNRFLLRLGVFRSVMRYLTYPVEWCFAELHSMGFENLEIVFIAPSGSHTPTSVVFGTKKAS